MMQYNDNFGWMEEKAPQASKLWCYALVRLLRMVYMMQMQNV